MSSAGCRHIHIFYKSNKNHEENSKIVLNLSFVNEDRISHRESIHF